MVTGFAAVGTLLAAYQINMQEGNADGDDERRLRDYAIMGAGVGVLVEWLTESALSRRAPSLSLGPTQEGGVAFGLRVQAPSW